MTNRFYVVRPSRNGTSQRSCAHATACKKPGTGRACSRPILTVRGFEMLLQICFRNFSANILEHLTQVFKHIFQKISFSPLCTISAKSQLIFMHYCLSKNYPLTFSSFLHTIYQYTQELSVYFQSFSEMDVQSWP